MRISEISKLPSDQGRSRPVFGGAKTRPGRSKTTVKLARRQIFFDPNTKNRTNPAMPDYQPPGIYFPGYAPFPPSIVPIATAIPAFIGYT